jgi:hypothetical protein
MEGRERPPLGTNLPWVRSEDMAESDHPWAPFFSNSYVARGDSLNSHAGVLRELFNCQVGNLLEYYVKSGLVYV